MDADHLLVVLNSDVESGRFSPSPPFPFRWMQVPDSRIAFIVMLSAEEFELWKEINKNTTLYPHDPFAKRAPGEEAPEADVTQLGISNSDTPTNMPNQTTAQKAYKIIQQITLQRAIARKKEIKRDNGQDDSGGKSGEGQQKSTGSADLNIPAVGDTLHLPATPGKDPGGGTKGNKMATPVLKLPKSSAYPRSKVVRRFATKRFLNRARKNRRNVLKVPVEDSTAQAHS